MQVTPAVKTILDHYESDNPGTKANLARILMAGKLGGTGKMVILPVDQGFEHGPARSFAPNPAAYDPHYHFRLALAAGLNAYAAPLGMIEAGAGTYAGAIPTILKVNSSNSLATEKNQAVTGSVGDALRLGCSAIGFTIYPGSEYAFAQMNELRELSEEAKSVGLAVVVWSYPRGPMLDKAAETAVDICAYAAHMAALMGAHIIKVKPPTNVVSLEAAKKTYATQNIDISTMAARVRHVVQACFQGRRIVVFSGGEAKDKHRRDPGGDPGPAGWRGERQHHRAQHVPAAGGGCVEAPRGHHRDLPGQVTADCRLYLVTPVTAGAGFADTLARALDAGDVAAVQLRLKEADDDAWRRAIDALRPVAQSRGVSFLLNDRPELVRATGCDGAHVGQTDTPAREARLVMGPDATLGVTCHDSRDLAMQAGEDGADYVAFGAFFPTATKEAPTRADVSLLAWWVGADGAAGGGDRGDHGGELRGAGEGRGQLPGGGWARCGRIRRGLRPGCGR